MDIYEALEKDHEELKGLLGKLSHKRDNKLFEQLKAELIVHNEAEEEVFYKPLKAKVGKLGILVDAGDEEHGLAMEIVAELAKIENDKEWQCIISVLKKSIEAHIVMEEEDLFSLAKKNFSDKEAQEMGKKFEKLKEDIKKNPK